MATQFIFKQISALIDRILKIDPEEESLTIVKAPSQRNPNLTVVFQNDLCLFV